MQVAHGKADAYCMCQSEPTKLVVKRYKSDSQATKYGLARWPDTGLLHAPECDFFAEDDGKETERTDAFEDLDNGKFRVTLDTPLMRTVEKGKATEFIKALTKNGRTNVNERSQRERATADMLLRKLWRTARLNVHDGKNRNWYTASFAIIKAATKIEISRKGETFADYLYVMSASNDSLTTEHNKQVLRRVAVNNSRMFVIGRMRPYKGEKEKTSLQMVDGQKELKILASLSQLDEAIGESNFVKNLFHSKSCEVIGLATIEPAGGAWWNLVSLVTFTTSPHFIPASTTAELMFEDYLRKFKRTFIKPLLVHGVGSEEATSRRPEYILLDVVPRTRFQLWGVTIECDMQQKQAAHINSSEIIHWSFNPFEPLPNIPIAE